MVCLQAWFCILFWIHCTTGVDFCFRQNYHRFVVILRIILFQLHLILWLHILLLYHMSKECVVFIQHSVGDLSSCSCTPYLLLDPFFFNFSVLQFLDFHNNPISHSFHSFFFFPNLILKFSCFLLLMDSLYLSSNERLSLAIFFIDVFHIWSCNLITT